MHLRPSFFITISLSTIPNTSLFHLLKSSLTNLSFSPVCMHKSQHDSWTMLSWWLLHNRGELSTSTRIWRAYAWNVEDNEPMVKFDDGEVSDHTVGEVFHPSCICKRPIQFFHNKIRPPSVCSSKWKGDLLSLLELDRGSRGFDEVVGYLQLCWLWKWACLILSEPSWNHLRTPICCVFGCQRFEVRSKWDASVQGLGVHIRK